MFDQNRRKNRETTRPNDRRGIVIVTVLTIFAVAMALFGLWARAAIVEHRRIGDQHLRLQAGRLAEAGLRRAAFQRRVNPGYETETWSVPAAELDQLHAAEVRIHVVPSDDAKTLRIEATAEFPIGAVRHAQLTKRIEIANPNPGNET